jgi:hypothetical protein
VFFCSDVAEDFAKIICAECFGLGHFVALLNRAIALIALCFHIFIWTTGVRPIWRVFGVVWGWLSASKSAL